MSAIAELDHEFHTLLAALEAEGHTLAAKFRDWYHRVTHKSAAYTGDVETGAGEPAQAPAAAPSPESTPDTTEEPR